MKLPQSPIPYSKQYGLLCSFDQKTGWRVRKVIGCSNKVCVVQLDGVKYLFIPALHKPRNGQFCNPKTLALDYVRIKTQQRKEALRMWGTFRHNFPAVADWQKSVKMMYEAPPCKGFTRPLNQPLH